jgi:DNA-binding GntR family transcriptional regulator
MGLVTASVAEQALEVLRRAIWTGVLKAGQRYSADELAKQYGVSRTPVREALVRLSEAGFVTVEPKVGFRVVKRNARQVQELFQMRLMLEVPAAYCAALADVNIEKLRQEFEAMDEIARSWSKEPVEGRAHDRREPGSQELDLRYVDVDTRFHECILAATGNNRLVLEVRKLRHNITALGAWRLSKSRRENGLLGMQEEHKAMLDAMEERDPPAAAHAMYAHLVTTGDLLMKELEREGEGGFDREWYTGVVVPDR